MSITLVSKEAEKFKVTPDIQGMSQLIADMLEDNGDEAMEEDIPLANVSSKFLKIILEYCEHHQYKKNQTDIIAPLTSKVPKEFIKDPWEVTFISQFNEDELIDLIQAANYMNIPALFELSCAMIASELKGKDFNEMKRRYGLDDVNYTPAEEEEILKQYPWILAETEEKIKKLKLDQLN